MTDANDPEQSPADITMPAAAAANTPTPAKRQWAIPPQTSKPKTSTPLQPPSSAFKAAVKVEGGELRDRNGKSTGKGRRKSLLGEDKRSDGGLEQSPARNSGSLDSREGCRGSQEGRRKKPRCGVH